MYAKTFGETVCGINGEEIIVEVDISNGLPGFDIVGLPDTAVKESRERVRAALKNSGLMFPMTRITVNLAPADLRKDGSSLDLLEMKFCRERDNAFVRSLTDSVKGFEYRSRKQAETLERARLLNEQAEQLKEKADKLGKP